MDNFFYKLLCPVLIAVSKMSKKVKKELTKQFILHFGLTQFENSGSTILPVYYDTSQEEFDMA